MTSISLAADRASLARIARDHGLSQADLLKAVAALKRRPVSDRMALNGEA